MTLDASLVAAVADAVQAGQARSVSGWFAQAAQVKIAHDRRLAALHDAVMTYETEHGAIDDQQIAAQEQADQTAAGKQTPPR